MLEKPGIADETISACLQAEYGLAVIRIAFLPLGADLNTAVYRAETDEGKPYFVKLRSGGFDEISVDLPKFLSEHGVSQIIAPVASAAGQLWASLGAFKMIVYPFIDGSNGYEAELSDRHWVEFGATLKKIHTARIPAQISSRIQREKYAPQGRQTVRKYLEQIETESVTDELSGRLAAYLKTRRVEILDLVEHTEQLAAKLQGGPADFVVCHADLHAGNILMQANGDFFIVDWDAPILAHRERDLMFAGGGQFGNRRTAADEETLFYQGYGPTRPNPVALAYYRFERIIQDLAVECEQIFLKTGSQEDREQAFEYLVSNFLPNNVIDIARNTDTTR